MHKDKWLKHTKKLWVYLANSHPYYYVITDPQYKSGPNMEFWSSGMNVAASIMDDLSMAGLELEKLSVAELGVGVGRVLRNMTRPFLDATGYDISPEMIKLCRKNNPDMKCRIYKGDMPEKSFDVVYSVITLQHNYPQNQAMMLEDMFSAARKAVWFNLPFPTGQESNKVNEEPHVPMYGMRLEDVAKIGISNGFDLVRTKEDDYTCPTAPGLQYLFISS